MLRSSLSSFILLISISWCSVLCSPYDFLRSNYGKDPDERGTPCELIQSRGFICENHWIRTDDDYILSVQRIINPVLRQRGKTPIKPYVLQHGLFGSAAHFLTNAPGGFADDWTAKSLDTKSLQDEGRNLAYLLANFNYDVWLPNSRGNKYSTNHTTLNPNKFADKFWQFSFDQMIAYDAPAVINYILYKTNSTSLGWIGHSQGTTIMFGLLSEKPEYAAKVEPFIALAPVAHVTHIESPLRALASLRGLKDMFYLFPNRLTIPQELQNEMAEKCDRSKLRDACSIPLFLACGYNPSQLNYTRLPVYITQGFAETSNWDLLHFAQNIVNKGFYKFDHGKAHNLYYHYSLKPPAYDLGAIKSKSIFLFTSLNDLLASPQDVQTLRKSMEVKVVEYSVSDPSFNHMDFIWAKDVYHLLYKRVLKTMKKFDQSNQTQPNDF
ncbi:gastric triacylglycerol lipase isoform X1 [Tetranychus urticae]|uniref:gastric triacylglycerol lipase isoform X1 n=1 Tax=Tetranychus urticae TaxID=32264 RepID=UPI000D651C58|nr:gastric triacylglycerol lipase isoform X1 [Tetranychus urticae]